MKIPALFAAITLSLISLLSCVTTDARDNRLTITNEKVVTILVDDGMGTGFSVGPHTIATASHMCMENTSPTASIFHDSQPGILAKNKFLGWGWFTIVGIEDPINGPIKPAFITTEIYFTHFYKMDRPHLGQFGKRVSLERGDFSVWFLTEQIFIGEPPIPGESGSPILQLRNKEWVAVGVVTHSITKGGLYGKFNSP